MSSASIEPARAIRATVAGVIPFTLGAVGGLLLTGRPDRPPLVPREYAYFQYLMLGLVTLIASFIFHTAMTRSWRPSLWQAEDQANHPQNRDASGEAAKLRKSISSIASLRKYLAVFAKQAGTVIETTEKAATDLFTAVEGIKNLSDGLRSAVAQYHIRAAKLQQDADAHVRTHQEAVKRIDPLVDKIAEVARQTNLIAINAAIEAARAGEAGLGFAVVADEVRRLATKAQEATENVDGELRRMAAIVSALHAELAAMVSYLGDASREIGSSAQQVEESVLGVLGKIQFQDIVRQQLEHIQKGLRLVAKEIVRAASGDLEDSAGAASSKCGKELESLYHEYTMHSQRAIHDEVLGRENREASRPNVELF